MTLNPLHANTRGRLHSNLLRVSVTLQLNTVDEWRTRASVLVRHAAELSASAIVREAQKAVVVLGRCRLIGSRVARLPCAVGARATLRWQRPESARDETSARQKSLTFCNAYVPPICYKPYSCNKPTRNSKVLNFGFLILGPAATGHNHLKVYSPIYSLLLFRWRHPKK